MILRKACDIMVGDILDIEGHWCVENIWVSKDSRHIDIMLSNRGVNLINAAGKIDYDALKADTNAILKRLTVRATDYISIKTTGIVRDYKDED
jgi:hypothetical protein